MKSDDYQGPINVEVSPKEAFEATNNVSNWWAKKVQGSTHKLGDVFKVRFWENLCEFYNNRVHSQ